LCAYFSYIQFMSAIGRPSHFDPDRDLRADSPPSTMADGSDAILLEKKDDMRRRGLA
jgi:hypothetical protein